MIEKGLSSPLNIRFCRQIEPFAQFFDKVCRVFFVEGNRNHRLTQNEIHLHISPSGFELDLSHNHVLSFPNQVESPERLFDGIFESNLENV